LSSTKEVYVSSEESGEVYEDCEKECDMIAWSECHPSKWWVSIQS